MASFSTRIAQMGNNTGIEVPPTAIEELGGGKKPAVVVTIGDFVYRTTVGVMGGKFLVPLSAERRAASGLKGGDAVLVHLDIDDAPRMVDVPDDLAAALAAEPIAKAFFDGLTFSQQQVHVRSVADAKTEDTRRRRIEKSVAMLVAGKK